MWRGQSRAAAGKLRRLRLEIASKGRKLAFEKVSRSQTGDWPIFLCLVRIAGLVHGNDSFLFFFLSFYFFVYEPDARFNTWHVRLQGICLF